MAFPGCAAGADVEDVVLEGTDGADVAPLGELAPVVEGGAVEDGLDQPETEDGEGAVVVSLVVTSRGCGEEV